MERKSEGHGERQHYFHFIDGKISENASIVMAIARVELKEMGNIRNGDHQRLTMDERDGLDQSRGDTTNIK